MEYLIWIKGHTVCSKLQLDNNKVYISITNVIHINVIWKKIRTTMRVGKISTISSIC